MARRNVTTTTLPAFLGGIDLDSNPFEVPEDCLIDTSNVIPSLSVGGITVRNGISKQNPQSQISQSTVAKAINGIISFYAIGGGTEYFIAQAGSNIWMNSPEGIWNSIIGSLIIQDSQNNLASFAVLNNVLYGVNRLGDQMWYWPLTGNALAVPSGALYSVTINTGSPGTGYSLGDVLTLTGGTGGTVTVIGLTGSTINAVSITTPGSGYVATQNQAVTGGTGTGATFTVVVSTPLDNTFLVNFFSSIFGGGSLSFPQLLSYSDINNGNSFNPINFLNFDTGQGSKLTGAVNGLFGNLIVFKDKSIHVVQPTGTVPAFTNYLFVDGIGCVSHQSIVTLPGGSIMWWDTDDIYILNGNQVSSATIHPKNGTPRLRNFFRNNVNQGRLNQVCGVYYPALDIVRWFYSSPGSNSNDEHIDYHVPTKSFWPFGTNRGTSCAVRIIQGKSMLMAGDTNGFIYQQDNGLSDDGANIVWNARVPWQAMEGLTIRKKGDMFYCILEQGTNFNVLCDIFLDQSGTAFILNGILSTITLPVGTSVFDSATFDTSTFASFNSAIIEASILINTLFKTISVNIHGSNLNQPLNIHRVIFTERPLQLTRSVT